LVVEKGRAPIKKEFKEERVDEVWDTIDSFDGLFLEELPRVDDMNFDEKLQN
jgi:hypothetical protein